MKRKLAIAVMLWSVGCTLPVYNMQAIQSRQLCDSGSASACIDYARLTQPPVYVSDGGAESQREVNTLLFGDPTGYHNHSFSCYTQGAFTSCY